MTRARHNDGIRSHVENVLPIRPSLVNAVLGAPEPIKRAPRKTYHGPKPAGGAPPSKLTDEQVLHIRALHQFGRMKRPQIARLTGVDLGAVVLVTEYKNRVHLEPRPEHMRSLPAEPTAAAQA